MIHSSLSIQVQPKSRDRRGNRLTLRSPGESQGPEVMLTGRV